MFTRIRGNFFFFNVSESEAGLSDTGHSQGEK